MTILALIIGLKRKNLHKELNPILYFILLSLFIDIVSFYTAAIARRTQSVNTVEKLATDIFVMGEFGFYMVFILNNIGGSTRKKITRGIIFLFYLCILIGSIVLKKHDEFDKANYAYVSISTLDSISIIIASFFYFYELFKSSNFIDLKELPSFWVVTAILFYNCCSLPIYVFERLLYTTNPYYYRIIFSLNFMLYSLVYIIVY